MDNIGQQCVMLFESIHNVMGAEQQLKNAGMWCDLIPTPRQLSSECGMAVAIHYRDYQSAVRIIGWDTGLAGLFRIVGDDVEAIVFDRD